MYVQIILVSLFLFPDLEKSCNLIAFLPTFFNLCQQKIIGTFRNLNILNARRNSKFPDIGIELIEFN